MHERQEEKNAKKSPKQNETKKLERLRSMLASSPNKKINWNEKRLGGVSSLALPQCLLFNCSWVFLPFFSILFFVFVFVSVVDSHDKQAVVDFVRHSNVFIWLFEREETTPSPSHVTFRFHHFPPLLFSAIFFIFFLVSSSFWAAMRCFGRETHRKQNKTKEK